MIDLNKWNQKEYNIFQTMPFQLFLVWKYKYKKLNLNFINIKISLNIIFLFNIWYTLSY